VGPLARPTPAVVGVALGAGDGHGQVYGDVDHLLIGPPGLVSINTKHHRTGKLYLDRDRLVLNGRRTDYVPKARREADRVTRFLHATLAAHGHAELAARVPVRPLLAIVGGRLMTDRWPAGVTVVMTSTLIEAVRAFPAILDPDEVAAVYELARRSTTWNPPIAEVTVGSGSADGDCDGPSVGDAEPGCAVAVEAYRPETARDTTPRNTAAAANFHGTCIHAGNSIRPEMRLISTPMATPTPPR
jgi:hypothetical protein